MFGWQSRGVLSSGLSGISVFHPWQYTINGKKVEVAVKQVITGKAVEEHGAFSNPEPWTGTGTSPSCRASESHPAVPGHTHWYRNICVSRELLSRCSSPEGVVSCLWGWEDSAGHLGVPGVPHASTHT